LAVDLAIDYNTGDLLRASNKDIELRTGQPTVDQRIRVRLRAVAGEWPFDATLGSRLQEAMRYPMWRALQEVPLIVREALAPMTDITLQDVLAEPNADKSSSIDVTILYAINQQDSQAGDILTTILTVEE
jgi:hypothetical protein